MRLFRRSHPAPAADRPPGRAADDSEAPAMLAALQFALDRLRAASAAVEESRHVLAARRAPPPEAEACERMSELILGLHADILRLQALLATAHTTDAASPGEG